MTDDEVLEMLKGAWYSSNVHTPQEQSESFRMGELVSGRVWLDGGRGRGWCWVVRSHWAAHDGIVRDKETGLGLVSKAAAKDAVKNAIAPLVTRTVISQLGGTRLRSLRADVDRLKADVEAMQKREEAAGESLGMEPSE